MQLKTSKINGSHGNRWKEDLKKNQLINTEGYVYNPGKMSTTQPRSHIGLWLFQMVMYALRGLLRQWKVLESHKTHVVHTALPGFCSKSSRHSSSCTAKNCSTISSRRREGGKVSKTFQRPCHQVSCGAA